jgi:hypothetical protein
MADQYRIPINSHASSGYLANINTPLGSFAAKPLVDPTNLKPKSPLLTPNTGKGQHG